MAQDAKELLWFLNENLTDIWYPLCAWTGNLIVLANLTDLCKIKQTNTMKPNSQKKRLEPPPLPSQQKINSLNRFFVSSEESCEETVKLRWHKSCRRVILVFSAVQQNVEGQCPTVVDLFFSQVSLWGLSGTWTATRSRGGENISISINYHVEAYSRTRVDYLHGGAGTSCVKLILHWSQRWVLLAICGS